MKTFRLIILTFCFLVVSQTTHATHVMGAEITYKSLDSLKYEITFTFYRDCNGTPFSNPSNGSSVRCASGGQVGITLTLDHITELKQFCDTVSIKCSPTNTQGTGNGIEKHVYKGIVDFTSNTYSALANCGTVLIEAAQCCRSSDINTGAASANFYTYAEIVLSESHSNSSPTFAIDPISTSCCNQPATLVSGAIDTIDYDSLSYAWGQPLSAWNTSIGYSGTWYAYNHPFQAYYPGSLTPPYKNPNTTPPIGIALNSQSGEIILTPTRCDEITVAVVEVTEWRKDTSGTYQKIGLVRRDMQFETTQCPNNNPPKINGPNSYEVCEGKTLCFDVTTSDVVFTPPPPAPSPDPDTVSISWNRGIPSATFTVINPNDRLQTGRFCWTPAIGSASNLPYVFTASARDNNCPLLGKTSRTFKVKVAPFVYLSATSTLDSLACNTFKLTSAIDTNSSNNTPQYLWDVIDFNGQLLNQDQVSFSSTDSPAGFGQLDTLQFYVNGNYIIRHTINVPPGICPFYNYDTVSISNRMETTLNFSDTLICANDNVSIQCAVQNGKSPYTYTWTLSGDTLGESSNTLTPLLEYGKKHNFTVLVTDSNNCNSKEMKSVIETFGYQGSYFKSVYQKCLGDSVELSLNTWLQNPIWNRTDSTYFFKIFNSSNNVLTYNDGRCSYVDSIEVRFYSKPPINLNDTTLCGNSVSLDAGSYATYLWSSGDTSSSITATTSGSYWVQVTDQSNCTNQDTAEIKLLGKPTTPQLSLTIDTIYSSGNGKHHWYKDGNWISTTSANWVVLQGFGSYYAIAEDSNGCLSDTSNVITKLASLNSNEEEQIKIYPNPSNGQLSIEIGNHVIKSVQLYDALGKKLVYQQTNNGSTIDMQWNTESGVLYLVIKTERGLFRKEIIYLK